MEECKGTEHDSDEVIGKGEARMEPVDVDVIDNLVNAQAAYLEALTVALEHVGIGEGELAEDATMDVVEAQTKAQGLVLTAYAIKRA